MEYSVNFLCASKWVTTIKQDYLTFERINKTLSLIQMKCLIHKLQNAALLNSLQNPLLRDFVATALRGLVWPVANGS